MANGHPHIAAAGSAHRTVQQRAMLAISVCNSKFFNELLKIPVSLSRFMKAMAKQNVQLDAPLQLQVTGHQVIIFFYHLKK